MMDRDQSKIFCLYLCLHPSVSKVPSVVFPLSQPAMCVSMCVMALPCQYWLQISKEDYQAISTHRHIRWWCGTGSGSPDRTSHCKILPRMMDDPHDIMISCTYQLIGVKLLDVFQQKMEAHGQNSETLNGQTLFFH